MGTNKTNTKAPTALVVEDDPLQRDMAAMLLEESELDVLESSVTALRAHSRCQGGVLGCARRRAWSKRRERVLDGGERHMAIDI